MTECNVSDCENVAQMTVTKKSRVIPTLVVRKLEVCVDHADELALLGWEITGKINRLALVR